MPLHPPLLRLGVASLSLWLSAGSVFCIKTGSRWSSRFLHSEPPFRSLSVPPCHREAAAMCAIPPNLRFSGEGRSCLCYIGQSASPMQDMWMWANFFKGIVQDGPDPQFYLTSHIMYMLKEIHGGFLFADLPAQVHYQRAEGEGAPMTLTPSATIAQWKKAEQNLLGWGTRVWVKDEQGVVPDYHLLQSEALLGTYTLVEQQKKQIAPKPFEAIQVWLSDRQGETYTTTVSPGTFLFEILQQLNLPRNPIWLDVNTMEPVTLDQRIWKSSSFTQA